MKKKNTPARKKNTTYSYAYYTKVAKKNKKNMHHVVENPKIKTKRRGEGQVQVRVCALIGCLRRWCIVVFF